MSPWVNSKGLYISLIANCDSYGIRASSYLLKGHAFNIFEQNADRNMNVWIV